VFVVAGRLLVAHTAWEMVTARQRLTQAKNDQAVEKEDVSFTHTNGGINDHWFGREWSGNRRSGKL